MKNTLVVGPWKTEAGLRAAVVQRGQRLYAYVAVPWTHKLAQCSGGEARGSVDVDEGREALPGGVAGAAEVPGTWWFGQRAAEGRPVEDVSRDCESLAADLQGIG